MSNSPNLNRLEYFVAIVEEGSITAAARRLEISKAVVSRQLRLLEEELAVSLILRTSRQMKLTDIGQQVYEIASGAVGQANQAYQAAREANLAPSGKLRVTAAVDLGLARLATMVAEFVHEFPDVQIELSLSDKRFDLIESNFDVSIRTGWLTDSSYLARKLGEFHQCVLFSPAFLEKYGHATSPADLEPLPFVENRALSKPLSWTFKNRGQERSVTLSNPAISVDVTTAAAKAVASGSVFSIMPDFTVAPQIKADLLVPLLQNWVLPKGGIFAVFPPSRHRNVTTRAFVDFIVKKFGNE